MTKTGSEPFEIPSEMRAFAEQSVEQARQAFEGLMAAAQQAAGTADKQAKGARDLSALAARLAERNVAASFAFAGRLARAKDTGEVLALQADYVKSQVAALNAQAKELGDEAAKFAGQAGTH
jgi:hypothetical protein